MNMASVRRGSRLNAVIVGEDIAQAYAGCPVQQEAREVQKVKNSAKFTYAEATCKVKGIVETKITNVQGIRVESYTQKGVNPARNESDLQIMMNKTDFVVFICAVINGIFTSGKEIGQAKDNRRMC